MLDGLNRALSNMEQSLQGWPSIGLTLLLLVLAGLLVVVALYGSARVKAGTAAWVIFP